LVLLHSCPTSLVMQDIELATISQRVRRPFLQPDGRLHCTSQVRLGSSQGRP
jgi:hypothetical protein